MRKKTLMMILVLFIFSFIVHAEDILTSSNGRLMVNYDTRYNKIVSVEGYEYEKKAFLDSLEIGFIIDNEFFKLKDFNPKVQYINGTNIIKIDGSLGKIKITTHISAPIDEKKSSFFILNEVITDDIKSKKDIKAYYYIDSAYKSSKVFFDETNNTFFENDFYFKTFSKKSNLYLTTDEELRELKLRKVYTKRDKEIEDKILLISDFGKMDIYESKKDLVSFSFGKEATSYDLGTENYLIDNEKTKWNFWHKDIELTQFNEIEKATLLQSLAILKMAQISNGAVTNKLGEGEKEFLTEDMLFAALAFIKSSHYEEAKEVLRYILKAKTGYYSKEINHDYMVANYAYYGVEAEEKTDRNIVSFYNQGLFLYVFSEYLSKTGDMLFLKDNFMELTNKVTDLLLSKLEENNLIAADSYNGEVDYIYRKHYVNTQYMVYKGLVRFNDEIKFFAPSGFIKKLDTELKKLKTAISKNYYKENKVLDSLETEEYRLRNVILADENIFGAELDDIINYYSSSYLKAYENGFNGEESIHYSKMEDILTFLSVLYNNSRREEADEYEVGINKLIKENQYIVPEYVKIKDNLKKYGEKGIQTIDASKYIIMLYSK